MVSNLVDKRHAEHGKWTKHVNRSGEVQFLKGEFRSPHHAEGARRDLEGANLVNPEDHSLPSNKAKPYVARIYIRGEERADAFEKDYPGIAEKLRKNRRYVPDTLPESPEPPLPLISPETECCLHMFGQPVGEQERPTEQQERPASTHRSAKVSTRSQRTKNQPAFTGMEPTPPSGNLGR